MKLALVLLLLLSGCNLHGDYTEPTPDYEPRPVEDGE